MGNKVPIQGDARTRSGACARGDTADMCGTRRSDCARGDLTGPHPHVAVSAAGLGAGEGGAIHQREVVAAAANGIPGTGEAVLGTTFVGARIFLRDGGCGG